MATIEDYTAAAPTLMAIGSFTVTQIENKLASIPNHPDPGIPPTITQQIVVDIFNQIFGSVSVPYGLSLAGGYGGLARQHGISKQQAKTIVLELEAMLDVYQSQGE